MRVVVACGLFLLREGPAGLPARPSRAGRPPPASLTGTSHDDDAVLR